MRNCACSTKQEFIPTSIKIWGHYNSSNLDLTSCGQWSSFMTFSRGSFHEKIPTFSNLMKQILLSVLPTKGSTLKTEWPVHIKAFSSTSFFISEHPDCLFYKQFDLHKLQSTLVIICKANTIPWGEMGQCSLEWTTTAVSIRRVLSSFDLNRCKSTTGNTWLVEWVEKFCGIPFRVYFRCWIPCCKSRLYLISTRVKFCWYTRTGYSAPNRLPSLIVNWIANR